MKHTKVYYIAQFGNSYLKESDFNIYESTDFTLSGYTGVVHIVGESHFLDFRELDFQHAVLSDKKVLDAMDEFDIFKDVELTNKYTSDKAQVTDKLIICNFDEKLLQEFVIQSQLKHHFAKNAITAIWISDDKNIVKTLHSYPEREKLVISETEFSFNI